MNALLKGACLAVYACAVAGLFAGMPTWVADVAIILLAAHALETVVALRYVKLYEGPLAVSVMLTLLFGFVHWMPLARAAGRPRSR